jgi:lipopolysaccharide transport system permease protein
MGIQGGRANPPEPERAAKMTTVLIEPEREFPAALPGAAAPLRAPRPAASWTGLVWTLVRTDFKARYHGTLSGFVWALLKPLAMFLVLEAVFSVIFAADAHYRSNLIIGLFLWDFFAEGTRTGMTSLHARGFLLTKARCPSWILVVTSISNALITLTVFAAAILAFQAASGQAPSALAALLFCGYLAGLAVVVTGIGLGTSVLFLRYRDLNQVWDVVIQAGFFVAPIIYPLRILPEHYHWLLYLWAPTPFIQFSRFVLVDGVLPGARAHAVLAAGTALILGAGLLVFRRYAPRAAEYL